MPQTPKKARTMPTVSGSVCYIVTQTRALPPRPAGNQKGRILNQRRLQIALGYEDANTAFRGATISGERLVSRSLPDVTLRMMPSWPASRRPADWKMRCRGRLS